MINSPGAYLARPISLREALAGQENYNNGTAAGGLAHVLQQALAGSRVATDRRQIDAAQEALIKGISPQPLPEGVQGPAGPGSIGQAASNLGELGDNPHARSLALNLALKQQADKERAGNSLDSRRAALEDYARKLQLEKAYGAGGKTPSSIAEWQTFQNMTPEDQNRYLTMKRANPYLNLGGELVQPIPTQPGVAGGGFQKTIPPEKRPDAVAEAEGAKVAAGEAARLEADKPALKAKATAAYQDLSRQAGVVISTIDKAVAKISPWSTGYGAFLDVLPETDARELKNLLDTIRANIGFDKLQRMRDASPTGGALGQVSELENKLLQATSGALDAKQPEQLRENLLIIKDLYNQILEEKSAAFNTDFGSPPDSADFGSPPDSGSGLSADEQKELDALRKRFNR